MADPAQTLGITAFKLRDEFVRTVKDPGKVQPEIFAPDFVRLDELAEEQVRDLLPELIQILHALGYLGRRDRFIYNGKLTQSGMEEIGAALARFYLDTDSFHKDFEYRHQETLGESGPPIQETQDHVLRRLMRDPLVLRYASIARLRAATALDGNLVPIRLPEEGEVTLLSRVLQYRLKLFGFLRGRHAKPGRPYGPPDRAALVATTWIKGSSISNKPQKKTLTAAFTTLGSVRLAAKAFVKRYRELPLCIPSDLRPERDIKLPDRAPPIPIYEAATLDVKFYSGTIWNSVGIRMLQLALWSDGYYLGLIDGQWGGQSQDAFDIASVNEGIRTREVTTRRVRRHKKFVFRKKVVERTLQTKERKDRAKRKYTMIEAAPFVSILLDLDRPESKSAVSADEIVDAMERNTTKWTNSDWEQFGSAIEKQDQHQDKGARLRYTGLHALRRGLSKIKKWLVELKDKAVNFVKDVIQKIGDLVGPLLHVGRYLYRLVRSAFRVGAQAVRRLVRLVSRTPYLTHDQNEFVLTRPSLDQDHWQFGSPGVSSATVGEHFERIEAERRALNVTLVLGIKIARAFATVTGKIQLAWEIARAVWNLFKELKSGRSKQEDSAWRNQMLLSS